MWRLESFYAVEKYADLPADDTNPYSFFPLGRLKWRIYDGICQMEGGQYTMDNEGDGGDNVYTQVPKGA